ncbi:MAG: alpha/beta hydrolase [Acidobacteriota bacterium]
MARLNINGTKLEYFENGSGESTIFVHGSASDYRTWHFQQDEFAQHFRTITYSRRYHWPNKFIAEGVDYSMKTQADDLEALVRMLDATPANLVGHSYGAFLCLLTAISQPNSVRTLVLAEPPVVTLYVSNKPKPIEIFKLFLTSPRTAIAVLSFGVKGAMPAANAFKKGDMEKGIRIFGDAVFGKGGYDRMHEKQKAQVWDNISNVKAELLGSGFLQIEKDSISTVSIPTLLVTGKHSPHLFHYMIQDLATLLPNSQVLEVQGASHLVHEDNAQAFNSAVLSFLAKSYTS